MLSHRDKASIALPRRLYRNAAKALSQCDKGPFAPFFSPKITKKRLPSQAENLQSPMNEPLTQNTEKFAFFGPNMGFAPKKPRNWGQKHK
jgi:hypothetical protein